MPDIRLYSTDLTKCSICTSFTRLEPGEPVTIGFALKTARMYVLTPELKHAPVGETGEIWLAGCQVMRGYIGAPEQTAQRIQADPWVSSERMYRTGDYGRLNEEGSVVYIGRLDRQVKVRGFRVELAGVEQKMCEIDLTIKFAAALAIDDTLVAVVSPASISVSNLRSRLEKALPPSWIPSSIQAVAQVPMTTNRKVDYAELSRLASLGRMKGLIQATQQPLDTVEEKIAKEWQTVLRMGADWIPARSSSFLQLGGHSILQMLLAARLTKAFGVNISNRNIIESPTLSSQADLVREKCTSSRDSEKDKGQRIAETALTELERQTWFQYQVATSVKAFNISVFLTLEGEYDHHRLVQSLNAVLSSHKIFRSNFVDLSNGPIRTFRATAPRVTKCGSIDLDFEANRAFDLEQDELIRVLFSGNQLMIVTSHAIADLNSIQSFLRAVSAAYAGQAPTDDLQGYLQASAWRRVATQENCRFWEMYLRDSPSGLKVSRTPSNGVFEGTSRVLRLQGDTIRALCAIAAKNKNTKQQLVSAIVAQSIQSLTSLDDLVLGFPYANRESGEEWQSMGLFLDRLPVRLTMLDADISLHSFLQRVREASLKAVSHAIPFSQILNVTGQTPSIHRHPIFETMVTFHPRAAVEDCLELPGCVVRREPCFSQGSKFFWMFEWTELNDNEWDLRIEYDSHQISSDLILSLERALTATIGGFAEEMGLSQLRDHILKCLDQQATGPRSMKTPEEDEMLLSIRRQMAYCLKIEFSDLPCTASFFDAGGDSMTALQLQRRLSRVGLKTSLRQIFEAKTATALLDSLKMGNHI